MVINCEDKFNSFVLVTGVTVLFPRQGNESLTKKTTFLFQKTLRSSSLKS